MTTRERAGLVSLVVAAGLATAATVSAQDGSVRPAGDVRQLGNDEAIVRELTADAPHDYEVTLDTGDFLHVVVAQVGVNVVLEFTGPASDQRQVINVSRLLGQDEHLATIARDSGNCVLRVRAGYRDAPRGTYAIRVVAHARATADDERRVEAERELNLAMRSDTPPAKADASAAHALELFRQLRDPEGELRSLVKLAGVRSGGHPEAAGSLQAALEAARGAGSPPYVANVLARRAEYDLRIGDPAAAARDAGDAIGILESLGDTREAANMLAFLGDVQRRQGDPERAVLTLRHGIELAEASGAALVRGFLHNNLGLTYKDLGDFAAALAEYSLARPGLRDGGQPYREPGLLNNMGNLQRLLGNHQAALDLHAAALALSRKFDNKATGPQALNGLSMNYYDLGDYARALDYAEQSLALRRTGGGASAVASSLHSVGKAKHRLGDAEGAVAALEEALALRQSVREDYTEPGTLVALAGVERDRGRLDRALGHVEAAVADLDRIRARIDDPELRASFVGAEHDAYELLVDILQRLHDRQPGEGYDARAFEASDGARGRVLLELLAQARTTLTEGVDSSLRDEEHRLQGQISEASTALSRALSTNAPADVVQKASASLERLTTDDASLRARVRRESPQYAAVTQPQPLRLVDLRERVLDADTVLLQFALGEERSFLWALTRDELSAHVLPTQHAIEALAREVYELATARQPRAGEIDRDYRARVARADTAWPSRARALSDMLLGPIADRLGGNWHAKRLVVVPEGALAVVPFAALPAPGHIGPPLLAEHEVVMAPSASSIDILRQRTGGRQTPGTAVVVFADPVFDAEDPRVRRGASPPTREAPSPAAPSLAEVRSFTTLAGAPITRLPFSRAEAGGIVAIGSPHSSILAVDFGANRESALGNGVRHARIVHFATHGLINTQQPHLSALVLSLVDERGRPRDGLLRLQDVFNLRLDADLVVLSACQTALGKQVRGEGLIGLTRGFMYAGAPRVVASLWQVSDAATAELMKRFYGAMLKHAMPPAAALRAAQLELAAIPPLEVPLLLGSVHRPGRVALKKALSSARRADTDGESHGGPQERR